VIYGAGRTGTHLVLALKAGCEYVPLAFVDDNPVIQETELAGLRVYSPDALPEVLVESSIAPDA